MRRVTNAFFSHLWRYQYSPHRIMEEKCNNSCDVLSPVPEESTHMIAIRVILLGDRVLPLPEYWACAVTYHFAFIVTVVIRLQWPGVKCKGTQGNSRQAVRCAAKMQVRQ